MNTKEREVDLDRVFSIKIASFNAIGFLLCIAGVTYVDARLGSNIIYGPRVYPYGYWVAVTGAIIIFLSSYFSILKFHFWKLKVCTPSIFIFLTAGFSTLFFKPEFPHAAIVEWAVISAIISLIGCFIHLSPTDTRPLKDACISELARIERIKEEAAMWRTLAVASTVGTIALIVPWSQLVLGGISQNVTDVQDVVLLNQFGAASIIGESLYMLVAVIYEAFHKATKVADLLFLIRIQHKNSVFARRCGAPNIRH